jgi:hypothetical protein
MRANHRQADQHKTPGPAVRAAGGTPTTTRWGAVVAVGVAIVLAALDMTIVAVALPAIGAELSAPPAVTQWVSLAYFLPMVALAIPVGRWLDRVRIRAAFPLAVVGFAVTSLMITAAPALWAVLAGRVLQGVFGALIGVLGFPVVAAAVRPEQRGRAGVAHRQRDCLRLPGNHPGGDRPGLEPRRIHGRQVPARRKPVGGGRQPLESVRVSRRAAQTVTSSVQPATIRPTNILLARPPTFPDALQRRGPGDDRQHVVERRDRWDRRRRLASTRQSNSVVTELDRGRDELRIVVDEQAVTRVETEKTTAGRVHPRIRLLAAEDLGDDEAREVLLDVKAAEDRLQPGPGIRHHR